MILFPRMGQKKWGVSMYDSQTRPDCQLYQSDYRRYGSAGQLLPAWWISIFKHFKRRLLFLRKNRKHGQSLSRTQTIEKIIKLLRCAFKQAVRWELIEKNPFDNVVLPKTEYKKRDIWDAETIRLALDQCTDSKLYIAMNLAFACSLRMGEILGLTWKNVHIEDENIATDNAYIYIEAELARASKQAIETLGEKDIYHIFTPLMPNTSTRIILKKPKTDSSIRKVWLPKTVAY